MHCWSKSLLVAGMGCVLAVTCAAQQADDDRPALAERKADERPKKPESKVSIPAGAQILLRLEHAITTKSAKVGDPIYAVTTFPYAVDGQMLVPAGTYVQGRISAIQRPGRVKGRAELLFHFTTLIYPNGYTVMLPGAVDNVPGMEHSTMKNEEGTIQQDSGKGHDVATAAEAAATGGLIGAAAGGLKGAGIGGAGGAVVGTAIALFSRGKDLRIEQGSAIQMVVQRSIDIDANRIAGRPLRGDLQRYDPQ
jgi:type IV secretion system protein VirB10